MKKTPFLSYILAALLASTGVQQAQATTTHHLTDASPTLDLLGIGAWWNWLPGCIDEYSRDYTWSDTIIEVESARSSIIGGRVGGGVQVNIRSGARLTLEPGRSGRAPGGFIQDVLLGREQDTFCKDVWHSNIENGTYSRTYVYMENNSSLDYRNENLWLGIVNFQEGATVSIKAGNLWARSISKNLDSSGPWEDYTINAHINIENPDTKLVLDSEYANIVTLKYDQSMNLEVARNNWEPRIDANGNLRHVPGTWEKRVRLDGCTLNLIDGKTSTIQGYLSGSTKISLGNGTALNGLEQPRQPRTDVVDHDYDGYNTDVSWLLNDIIVRQNCAASMNKGRFGGNVTMQTGSSLFFDVGLISSGQDVMAPEVRVAVDMAGNNTLNLAGRVADFDLTVAGTGNTLKNGTFLGTITLAAGSTLTSESALMDWRGPTSIVMKEGSTLVQKYDQWINDISAIKVEGSARIDNALLRIRNGYYKLGNGVQNLVGNWSWYSLGSDTFDLSNYTTKLNVLVWEGCNAVVQNGKIDTHVQLRGNAGLTLSSVTIGDNATFELGNGSTLNLGGAQGTAWFTLASGATATVSNGRIGIPGGVDSEMPYTLKFANLGNKPSYIEGNNVRLDLGANVQLSTNQKTRFLVHGDYLDNPTRPVSLDVVADGQFLLGDAKDGQGGSITRCLYGEVNISHKGQTRIDSTTFDVDVTGYRLMGDLTTTMNGCAIAIGPVGFENDGTTPGGTVSVEDADEIKVTSFIGQSMTLYASESVQLTGNGRAFGNNTGTTAVANLGTGAKLVIGGARGKNPDINFQANLSAHTIELTGQNISGTGVYGDARDGATFVEFADSCTINATGTIEIYEGFKGGALTVEGGGNVVLDLLGISEGASLASAKITSQNNSVSMRSFTGGSLNATAKEAVTISGNVAATGNVELSGDAVSIGGSLSASAGSAYIKSTAGNIEITGTLSARDSSTLESAKGITIGGNVTGGALTATAAQSIQLKDIGIGTKEAVLTATNGSITAGAITSGRLEASAAGAVTFNGAVAASTGNVAITGSSVGIQGALSANNASVVESTGGDITIGGNLSAGVSSTLISAANITVGGNVTGGELTATAAQSISMQNIGIGTRDAVLTALDGSITAGSFNGDVLRAEATGDVTINGSAAASTGATLMGSGVSVKGSLTSSDGRHYVKSSAGDIGITGTLNAEISSFLESAKNITIGGDATVGALTATAAQSIQMQNISIGANDAELKATGGSITAGAFTGGALKANANAALTLNGNVVASGAGKWQLTTAVDAPKYAVVLEGGSVSIGGNLAANQGKNYVKGTAGDIAITGTLNAKDSSTLDSAANITVGGDVTGGALTATAGGYISLQSISIGAKNAELTATGSSITAGNFIGSGALTATAGQSITLGNIGSKQQAAGTVRLTAGGGITAANVNAGMLTATAAGTITLNDVAVSQSEAQIVSTGEGGNVKLNAFNGGGALIKATHGSITVATGVTGSASTNRNNFIAAGSVTFNGATGDNNLEHAIIKAPQVNWSNGTTLKDVTVSHWAPPANSPLMLLAAGNGVPQTTLTVNGFLTLTENSTVNGDVVVNKEDNIEPVVTVANSTITGQVSGASELVLDSGSVGSVVVNDDGKLTVNSFGTSAITSAPSGLGGYYGQQIPTLILNGGSLTVTTQSDTGATGQVLVTELQVTENSALNSDMELQASGGATLIFDHLTAANEKKDSGTMAVLTMDGDLTSDVVGSGHGDEVSDITIQLEGNDEVEGGKAYALITLIDRTIPDFWETVDLTAVVAFNPKATAENFFWEGNTLYYQNGGELEAAIWAPAQGSHQWNTTDKNWLQDDVRYRYKDGVTTVFDDTAFNLLEGYEGDVHLESAYAPKKVQVNNSAGHNYTFMGSGAIDGTTTTLTKDGEGTLTITNANTYSGGTIIMQGTLEVAHAGALGSGGVTLDGGTLRLNYSGQTASFGTVTLQGGTVQIANGSKSFDLVVTGTDARMEGDYFNAFIGSLTLEAGSHLVSAGSLAGWDGPTSILMKNGSMLEMDPNCDIWINDITNLTVEGEATMFNAFLRINPYTNGGTYMLGNGVENLKGEGVTAYCLDGSTFDLNNHTTNLNIIVWNAQDEKKNVVEYGKVDTKVDIHDASRLYLGSDVVIGDRATFFMGDTAYLNLGGRSSMKARLNVFSFTGASATIDNGTLLVEKTKDGSPLVLGTNLRGEKTYVALRQESTLDLNRHSLAVEAVKLDADAASATIGNGTVASGVVVDAGKALHLGAALNVTGAVSGSGSLVKNDDGSTATITGSMKDFKGTVVVQGGTLNLMNIAEAAQLNEVDIAINSGTLGVYKGGTAAAANEGTLTISNGHTLTAGQEALLNADLVMGGGAEGAAVLDVHAMAGLGGLQMGSTVTLNPGLVLLSAEDMDGVSALRYMGKYDLFHGVDGLSLDGTPDFLSELGLADKWVKAADVFGNDLFQNAEDQYYVFYSGATQAGGKGGNVGTVYIMQVPEPATSTLSLLALAALAARRRK